MEASAPSSLTYRVFFAARDGLTITLYALLADKAPEAVRRALSQAVEDGGQRCAALLIAARNGHNKTVKMLLEKFGADLEQEGRVKFDDFTIDGASALWCAAGEWVGVAYGGRRVLLYGLGQELRGDLRW